MEGDVGDVHAKTAVLATGTNGLYVVSHAV